MAPAEPAPFAPAVAVGEVSTVSPPGDDLRHALPGGELEAWFQPKLSISTGAVVGAEALVRWRRDGEVRGAGEALSEVAQAGLMPELTRFMLESAVRECARWLAEGLQISVAVNISPHDVADPVLPDLVESLLDSYGLPGELLVLEITENAMLEDLTATCEVIERLRRVGVVMSADDFGVGYSSLSRLVRLNLGELKIDRSLVLGMRTAPHAAGVVRAVIDLGHVLGMRVVAEGVEDERTLTELRSLGCDLAQGFLFAPALPSDGLVDWAVDRRRLRTPARPADDPASVGEQQETGRAALSSGAGVVLAALGRPVVVAVSVYWAGYLAWQVLRWGGQAHQHLIGDAAIVPVNGAAILACWAAARAHRADRATRSAWQWLAAALACYLAGDLIQTYYEVVHHALPDPSWSDAGYVGLYPLAMIGLLRFPAPRRTPEQRFALAMDIAIVALGGCALIWAIDLAPTIGAGGGDALSVLTSLAYPVGDLVLLIGIVSVLLRGGLPTSARPLTLLLAGFGVLLVTDVCYSHLELIGAYSGGNRLNMGWVLALTLLLFGAVLHGRQPVKAADESSTEHTVSFSYLPHAATAVGYATLLFSVWQQPLVPVGGLVLAIGALIVLVTLRQLASMRANVRLLHRYHTLAAVDPLTGLLTRRRLLELAQAQFTLADQRETPLALLMIDVDHFRQVNDRFGHRTGDQVLCAVAEVCRAELRPGDLIGRHGGDEFVAVLADLGSADALVLAEQLRLRLHEMLDDLGLASDHVTLSIGVADTQGTRSLDAAFARADLALYDARSHGRNGVRAYGP